MNIVYRIIFKIEKIINRRRNKDLCKMFKFCGTSVRVDNSCHILVPQNMSIGSNTSISSYTTIYATFGVTIGENCLISSNCGISSYNHITNSVNRAEHSGEDFKYSKPVEIGNNVWIGMNVCILPGINVGNNSIIGAGSVVTKDVPPNEIWVGNPAKLVKTLPIMSS